jgi:hypothetical protein
MPLQVCRGVNENRHLACFTVIATGFVPAVSRREMESKLQEDELMGKLIVMPVKGLPTGALSNAKSITVKISTINSVAKFEASDAVALPAAMGLWESAPRERSVAYLPVYSSVAYAMQSALRRWVRDWVQQHPELLEKRVTGYSLLAFSCTIPYRGRTTNLFTYDVQQTSVVDRALRASSRMIVEQARKLDRQRKANENDSKKVHFVPEQVAKLVQQKRHNIYRMFHIETLLMDEILKFTQINIPKMGLQNAALELQSAFSRHLRRFTEEFDLSQRCAELLQIATDALRSHQVEEEQMPMAA